LLKEIGRPKVAHNIEWQLPNEIHQCSANQGVGIPVLAKQHSELIRTVDKQKSPEVKLRGIQTNKPK